MPSEETECAKSVRRRLYQKHEGLAVTDKARHLTKAEKQKVAREQVLTQLMDPTLIDPTRITDILAEWASKDLGIEPAVANRIFTSALVTTESMPSKSLFRIRVKL